MNLDIFSFFFSPVALQYFRTLATSHRRFLELFRHMVGLLGRVISPSQGLYLHKTTQHRKTRDKHPRLERDSNPRSQQQTGQDPRLRPHGHCDWLNLDIIHDNFQLLERFIFNCWFREIGKFVSKFTAIWTRKTPWLVEQVESSSILYENCQRMRIETV
jgi:hypothetical protein